MTTASATAATAARRRGVADAEADADRQLHVRADARDHRGDRGDVEVAGAGHALQRHVVDVAAGDLGRPGGCARRSRSARAGRSGRCRCAFSSARELLALLGRIVDDQHAVDAGRLRVAREALDARSARSGWRSPSAPPASSRSCWRKSRTIAEHLRQADAARQRALARLLDHRAVGHRVGERHAELDHVGAGRDHARASSSTRDVGVRVAGGDVRDQRLAAVRAAARRRWPAMRLMRASDVRPRFAAVRVAPSVGDGVRCPCRRGRTG